MRHLACLNLFVASDGKLYVTCSGGDADEILADALARGIDENTAADAVEHLVARAENIKDKA